MPEVNANVDNSKDVLFCEYLNKKFVVIAPAWRGSKGDLVEFKWGDITCLGYCVHKWWNPKDDDIAFFAAVCGTPVQKATRIFTQNWEAEHD